MNLTSSYTRVGSVTQIMYHGTDRKNLPIILSQGLIPNPKKRAWSGDDNSGFNVPSRASLPGIYLTTNLGTATASGAMRGNYGKCLVVVQVQSGSLLADEDDIKYRLNDSLPSHEYSLMTLYVYDQAIKQGLAPDDYDRDQMVAHVNQAKVGFVKTNLEAINSKIKGGLKPQEEQALIPVLANGFHVSLARKSAYLDYYFNDFMYEERRLGVKIPDKAQAEQDFKTLEDRLTRVLKRLGRPEHLESSFSPTARIETPITYSGKNRIIAVVEILPYIPGDGTPVIVRYPRSGEVPSKLIEDYTQSQGDWDEAVARGQRQGMEVPA